MRHTAQNRKSKSLAFSFALFVLIVVALFVLVMIATDSYKVVVEAQNTSNVSRASLSYLDSRIKAADLTEALARGVGPEGDALVLRENVQGALYETRIYLYEGMLMEEYSLAEDPFSPSKATAITGTETFSFEFLDQSLVRVTTDAGTQYVAIRSKQVGDDDV